MSTARCIVVARGEEATVRRRLERLVGYLTPLGATGADVVVHAGVVLATIPLRGRGAPDAGPAGDRWTWGAVPADAAGWDLATGDEALRAGLRQPGLVVHAGTAGVRVVTSAAAVTVAYRCEDVVATHAVAAAYVATGRATVDPRAVDPLVHLGFLGAGRTAVDGVRALPPATAVVLRPDGVAERSWWPAAQREAAPGGDAGDAAAAALERAAASVLEGARQPRLGLTGGLDSLVIAIALARTGRPFTTFTWQEGPVAEPAAAERARALEVEHEVLPFDLDGAGGPDRVDAEARWTEGVARLSAIGEPRWPARMDRLVTGAGGETGRAHLHRWAAHERPRPRPQDLVEVLTRGRPELREQVRPWVEAAREAGHDGWSALDLVYHRDRLASWGRSALPRADAPLVAPLLDPDVQRALLHLPQEVKLRDGFHHDYVAAHRPALAPPRPPAPRRGVPPALRRLAGRARRRRPTAPPAAFMAVWADRPAERERLAAVLASPLVREGLGRPWSAAAEAALGRGEPWAVEAALAASGPVALDAALRDLPPYAG